MKQHTAGGKSYRIPETLSDFQTQIYLHLIDWKWRHVTTEPGHHEYKGRSIPYDAILPEDYVTQQRMAHIYPPIREQLDAHRRRNDFRIHQHFYHMASSQAANINLFLPILYHPNASAILVEIENAPADFATLATDQLHNGYCLEYWGGNFSTDKTYKGPLGDKAPMSGTDADIAIAYRNSRDELCLWLIEHKLTEVEFSTCGGFKSRNRKNFPGCVCERSFDEILANRATCYQRTVRDFKYWDITESHRSLFPNHAQYTTCPFQDGKNQLWRNQLLALAIEKAGKPFKHASFSVVHHPLNTALYESLDAYKELVGNNPKFSSFTSADVIAAAERNSDAELNRWIAWYKDLYML